jgi:hypothetical protein
MKGHTGLPAGTGNTRTPAFNASNVAAASLEKGAFSRMTVRVE